MLRASKGGAETGTTPEPAAYAAPDERLQWMGAQWIQGPVVLGQMGPGSSGSRVRWVQGQMGPASSGSWGQMGPESGGPRSNRYRVKWVLDQMGPGSDGSRGQMGPGSVDPGSDGSRVRWVLGQMGPWSNGSRWAMQINPESGGPRVFLSKD